MAFRQGGALVEQDEVGAVGGVFVEDFEGGAGRRVADNGVVVDDQVKGRAQSGAGEAARGW